MDSYRETPAGARTFSRETKKVNVLFINDVCKVLPPEASRLG